MFNSWKWFYILGWKNALALCLTLSVLIFQIQKYHGSLIARGMRFIWLINLSFLLKHKRYTRDVDIILLTLMIFIPLIFAKAVWDASVKSLFLSLNPDEYR